MKMSGNVRSPSPESCFLRDADVDGGSYIRVTFVRCTIHDGKFEECVFKKCAFEKGCFEGCTYLHVVFGLKLAIGAGDPKAILDDASRQSRLGIH